MVKIFFPALGVGFSELCNIVRTFCHDYVNRIIDAKYPQKSRLLFPPCGVVLADEADSRFCLGGRIERTVYH
jgi:hypothetical protein